MPLANGLSYPRQFTGRRGFSPIVARGMDLRQTIGPGRFTTTWFLGGFRLVGTTLNSSGARLGLCAVHLFQTGDDAEIAETVSDANGDYTFNIGTNAGNFYVVAYKPGSPDVAGTTLNTLVALENPTWPF